MNSLGIIGLLSLLATLCSIMESVASKFIGNQEMWEVIKKFLAIILSFRDWLNQRKAEEQKKMDEEVNQQKQEVLKEYESAKKRLTDANYSDDAFESELRRLRDQQNNN